MVAGIQVSLQDLPLILFQALEYRTKFKPSYTTFKVLSNNLETPNHPIILLSSPTNEAPDLFFVLARAKPDRERESDRL